MYGGIESRVTAVTVGAAAVVKVVELMGVNPLDDAVRLALVNVSGVESGMFTKFG